MISTFDEAIAAAPCIMFIDEIDAAGSRDSGERQNSSYRRQVINAVLEQIDVAMRAEGVVLVGACNNPAALDPAILRPGRFDTHVEVPLPGRAAITSILKNQLGDELQNVDLDALVNASIGATPAAIDAAIRSARSHVRSLSRPMKASDVMERLTNGEPHGAELSLRIAIHECGHAILAVERGLGDLCHVRLGIRDGDTKLIPDLGAGLIRDHHNLLAYTLAGRASEDIVLGTIGGGSGGPAQTCDLAFATRIALAMETMFGFGADGLLWSTSDTGDRIADPILRAKVRKRLDVAQADAKRVLKRHHVLLLEMAKDLLRHRILEGTALQSWIDRIADEKPWDPNDRSGNRQASEQVSITVGGADVIDLNSHRIDAT